MLSAQRIRSLFERLNEALRREGEVGEVGIVGGAVMCLVYNAREATRDVDAVFEPSSVIRKLAERIARDENLPPDWLNDAAKGFVQGRFERETVLDLSNLKVWAPDARYMLAMKCISARWDTSDRDDVIFLVDKLELEKAEEVFELIESYYPARRIPPKTQFFIEELFGERA